jgi:hypothetical protein
MASNPDRFFIRIDPKATDEELESAADAAIDRLFGPMEKYGDHADLHLIDPFGGPDEPDPDLEGPDPEVGPDEMNGPWD